MNQHYIKSIVSYSMVGSLGLVIVAGLQGCDGDQVQENPKNQSSISSADGQGLFMVIQQTGTHPDTYELKEKYPSNTGTHAILKGMDGSERILNEAELKKIAEAEAKRVENGSSQLAQPSAQNQGLSLGETILASAAGTLIGGMLANKLMGNQNYQQNQHSQAQKAQSTMGSTRTPPTTGGTANTPTRSSFFGGGNGNPSNKGSGSSSRFGG